MKIYDGSIIIWCNGEGKAFNDVKKADKYFEKMNKGKNEVVWQRVFRIDRSNE